MKPLVMQLSDRIKFARKIAGLTQAQLAQELGIAQPSVHDLESGRTKSLRSSTLLRMSKVLGQPAEWLAGGVGSPSEEVTQPQYSKEEQNLLEDFSKLTAVERRVVVRMIRALAIDK